MMKLTSGQVKIVKTHGKNMLINSAPGSGKTTTLCHMIVQLVKDGVLVSDILILMFGNDAKKQFEAKLLELFKEEGITQKLPSVLTYHSLANRLLGFFVKAGMIPQFQLETARFRYDLNLLNAIKQVIPKDKVKKFQNKDEKIVDEFKSFVEYTKSWVLTPDVAFDKMYESKSDKKSVDFFIPAYEVFEEHRKQSGVKYFSDLVKDLVLFFRSNPKAVSMIGDKKDYVIVDEFQDSSQAQFEMLKFINGERANVIACGDIDQSIFTFAGADPKLMLQTFKETYSDAEVASLSTTFRFQSDLSSLSNNLIKNNTLRFDTKCKSLKEDGTKCYISMATDYAKDAYSLIKERHDKGMKYSDMAVLVRVYADALPIELELRKMGIPCTMLSDNSCVKSNEFKLAYALFKIAMKQDMNMPANERADLYKVIAKFPSKGVSNAVINDAYNKTVYRNEGFEFFLSQITYSNAVQKFIKPKIFKIIESVLDLKGICEVDPNSYAVDLLDKYIRNTKLKKDLSYNSMTEQECEDTLKRMEHVIGFIAKLSNPQSVIDAFEDIKRSIDIVGEGVTISSVHKAKGLEWDFVYIPNVVDGAWPYTKHKIEPCIETERRLFYVAISRAIKELFIHTVESKELFTAIRKGHEKSEIEKKSVMMSRLSRKTNFVLETEFKTRLDLSDGLIPKHIEIYG